MKKTLQEAYRNLECEGSTIAYEVTLTGTVFEDEESAKQYADSLKAMGYRTFVKKIIVV